MPTSEIIAQEEVCTLAERWVVMPSVMARLHRSAKEFEEETGRAVWIVSGYRTKTEQDALRARGRPTATENRSTHRSCPSTGVDITLGFGPTTEMKHIWARILFMNGLRMGGGSPLDDDLLPTDWQHVDEGPRIG